VDDVTRTLTRKCVLRWRLLAEHASAPCPLSACSPRCRNEELRMKRQQATSNESAAESLYAQVGEVAWAPAATCAPTLALMHARPHQLPSPSAAVEPCEVQMGALLAAGATPCNFTPYTFPCFLLAFFSSFSFFLAWRADCRPCRPTAWR
jgi:hypothetical protein